VQKFRWDPTRVFIGRGASEAFGIQNAMTVAVQLSNAGLWDGMSRLVINSPAAVAKKVLYLEGSLRSILVQGIDYEIYPDEPLIPEPRFVDRDHVAITGFCEHCEGQFDNIVSRRAWDYRGDRNYRFEQLCPICERILYGAVSVVSLAHPVDDEARYDAFIDAHGDDPEALQMTIASLLEANQALREELEANYLRAVNAEAVAAWLRQDSEALLTWYARLGIRLVGASVHRTLRTTLDHSAAGRQFLANYTTMHEALKTISAGAPVECPKPTDDLYEDDEDHTGYVSDYTRYGVAQVARRALAEVASHDVVTASAG
jgi:hypothetical protein